jgi:hypothetical protein
VNGTLTGIDGVSSDAGGAARPGRRSYGRLTASGLFLAVAVVLGTVLSMSAPARCAGKAGPGRSGGVVLPEAAAALPFSENRVHRIGNLWLTVTNYGMIGSFDGDLRDHCTGEGAPALEFPGGSGTINLYVGALWIGAVRGRDTLVSVGNDGWQYEIYEMYPKPYPQGAIVERTSRPVIPAPPNSRCQDVPHSDLAVSEEDIIATYYDTVTLQTLVVPDATDGRPHHPLGLEITQRSYAWSFDYAQDFILIDYRIRNIGAEALRQVYFGLFLDADAFHISHGGGWDDDFSGFLRVWPSPAGNGLLDTVNTVWTADNDGDPNNGKFDYTSHTSVTGVRVLRAPRTQAQFAFNWWISNANIAFDWGPVRQQSRVKFPHSGLGTPNGDRAKYQVMSNGEFDYDQIESAVSHEADGWLPPLDPPSRAANLADGFDTRYLLSTGAFELAPDSTLPFAVAVVAGEGFHVDPRDFNTFFDPGRPEIYRERLDFTDFAQNSQWASWVYDTPGFDTDGDGYKGEFRLVDEDTVYYRGDGIPDFKGPPPPPEPGDLSFDTYEGRIVMHWNGKRSELAKDPFSGRADFEGYRVYLSRTRQAGDFALLAQRDLVNYSRYRWNARTLRWQAPEPPFMLDSLVRLYDSLCRERYGFPFHPDSFVVQTIERALPELRYDPDNPERVDTLYNTFGPFDANVAVNDALAADAVAQGSTLDGVIRKRYPTALPDQTGLRSDGSIFWPYHEYEYALGGLEVAEPVYMAVTAFDHGNPGVGLASLESSPLATAREVWAINSSAVVNSRRPPPGVYPNPYRLSDDYNASGWEDPKRQGLDPERARKVTFTNVPDTCTIEIFSLDGDLVRRLEHRADPTASSASVVVWDLISRNTQAIKTGIYLWAIQSRFGTDVGKLVIVK